MSHRRGDGTASRRPTEPGAGGGEAARRRPCEARTPRSAWASAGMPRREVEGLRRLHPAPARPHAARAAAASPSCWSLAARQRHADGARARASWATPPTSSSTASSPARRHRLRRAAPHPAARPRPLPRARPSWPTCSPTCWPASCSAPCTGCAPTSRTSSTACRSATSTASPAATCSAGSPTTSTTSPRACSRRSARCSPRRSPSSAWWSMMFVISPLLALVALVTIPAVAARRASSITKPLEEAVHRPVAPHRHAQRPGRGGLHRPRAGEGVRPAGEVEAPLPREERGAVRGRASGPSSSPARSSRR